MAELVAIGLPCDDFVRRLRMVWDAGDAAFPVDLRLPDPVVEALLAAVEPTMMIRPGDDVRPADGRPVEHGDALVVATSGTTGVPRGVVLTHHGVAASAVATSSRLGVDPARDRWLACLPLHHVGGLAVVTRALLTDTPLVTHDGFDADRVRAAAAEGATLTSLVPTALARVEADMFRRILLGGAAPPDDLPDNVVATYGMTETGSGVVYDGWALDGVELKISDDEIHLRGPMLLRCYRDGLDPKDNEGWLATGDLGSINTDGSLRVDGRADDRINTGGEKVWPSTVEAVLAMAEGVAVVAVVGRTDDEWGQVVTAVVVPVDPAEPPTLDSLRALSKDHLPRHALPKALELASSLPHTPSGKLQRHLL